MRIAFLCKRRYMGKDVILDRYARLYEIPRQLARRGHDVLGLCLAYHDDADGEWEHESAPGRLRWRSRCLGRLRLIRLTTYPGHLVRQLRAFRPDLVMAASDIPHVVLGRWLSRCLGVPFVADLYDNFESFGLARVPGAVRAFRRAVGDADIVTCTGPALAAHVQETCGCRGHVEALPSTIDRQLFQTRDKAACRTTLGLPTDVQLVGTAGGLRLDRGIGTVIEAWRRLRQRRADVHLVLAGPADGRVQIPDEPGFHYLGQLTHEQVAQLFSALDVGIVYLRDTPFGRFCFPQKAYEMAASGLPFVGADVGEVARLLAETPSQVYAVDDPASLARSLADALAAPPLPLAVPQDWAQAVSRLDSLMSVASAPRKP